MLDYGIAVSLKTITSDNSKITKKYLTKCSLIKHCQYSYEKLKRITPGVYIYNL